MTKIKINNIKNIDNLIQLTVDNSQLLNEPVLYVKARKDETYSLKIKPQEIAGNTVEFVIDATTLSPMNLYYDLLLEYITADGFIEMQALSAKSNFQRLATNIFNLKHQSVEHTEHSYVVTEYFAAGGVLAFQVRERDSYDTGIAKFKEIIACLCMPFIYWYYKDSKLIYEKFSSYARDNSFYYFSYVQDHIPDNHLFYVIRKDSPDLKNVLPYKKHIVYFMSLKHLILIMASKYFIASETKMHAYAWRHNQSVFKFLINRKPFVFLQHGVLGLKQVPHAFFADDKMNHADLFITSSKLEKEIVTDYLGYQPENVVVTGLARWDNPRKEKKQKKIFVMPTWRVQLEFLDDEQFLKSDFYQAYSKLLHSDKIKRALREAGYTLHFMMHPKFVRFEKYFQSDHDNIKVMHQSEISIDRELKSSELLITDYSSITWDALYYGISVLLFQFDQEEYEELQGSYLDFNRDLTGLIVKDSSCLLDQIDMFFNDEEVVNVSSYQQKYFDYLDRHNSQRINMAVQRWEESYHFESMFKKIVSKVIKKVFRSQ